MTISPSHLRELLAKATPRPWRPDIGIYEDPDGDEDLAFARGPMVARNKMPSTAEWRARATNDSALIIAAVNALSELLDRMELAEGRVEAGFRQRDRACLERDAARMDLIGKNEMTRQLAALTAERDALRAALMEACWEWENWKCMALTEHVDDQRITRLRALAEGK